MRVLFINTVYNQGSVGKIVHDLYNELTGLGHDIRVLYGRGAESNNPNIIKISPKWEVYSHALATRLLGWVGKGSAIATNRAIKVISDLKPDVVHIHSLYGYYIDAYKVLNELKARHITSIITMHDEWIYTGKCALSYECEKWMASCGNCQHLDSYPKSLFFDRSAQEFIMKENIFRDFSGLSLVAVSNWLKDRAQQSACLRNKHIDVIYNGIDLNIFHPQNTDSLRERLNLTSEKVLVHVTHNFSDDRKGGKYIIDLAHRLTNEDVKIIIIGLTEPLRNCPQNVIAMRRTENQHQLAEYYSLGDIAIVSSKMETFSMVAAEALCCGTPVVGFDGGGICEIAPPPYGSFVEFGDMEKLESLVRGALSGEIALPDGNQCAQFGQSLYSKQKMAENYLELYKRVQQ